MINETKRAWVADPFDPEMKFSWKEVGEDPIDWDEIAQAAKDSAAIPKDEWDSHNFTKKWIDYIPADNAKFIDGGDGTESYKFMVRRIGGRYKYIGGHGCLLVPHGGEWINTIMNFFIRSGLNFKQTKMLERRISKILYKSQGYDDLMAKVRNLIKWYDNGLVANLAKKRQAAINRTKRAAMTAKKRQDAIINAIDGKQTDAVDVGFVL